MVRKIFGKIKLIFCVNGKLFKKKEGWNDDLTWGRQVKLPENFDTSLAIPKNTGSRKNWLKAWQKKQKKNIITMANVRCSSY